MRGTANKARLIVISELHLTELEPKKRGYLRFSVNTADVTAVIRKELLVTHLATKATS